MNLDPEFDIQSVAAGVDGIKVKACIPEEVELLPGYTTERRHIDNLATRGLVR